MNDTHRLAPHDRRRHWETWNSEALTPLDVFAPSQDGPIVSSQQRVFDDVKFTVLRGAAHAVHHDIEHIASKPQDSTFITIILVGEGFFYSSALTAEFHAGDALVYSVSEPYLIAFTGEMVQITVDIPGSRLEEWGIAAEHQMPRVITLPHDEAEAAQRLPQILSGRDETEMIGALALVRGVLAATHDVSEAARIYSACEELIRLNHMRADFDVAEMAESLNLSERQLRRVFEAYGRSPGRSLRDARLEAARQMIVTTSQPLKALAASSGFASTESLIRAYRSRYGLTPGAERERLRS
jgi:AraC-like DNA-binding protein